MKKKLRSAFRTVVIEGGALGAAAIDRVTHEVVVGFAHTDLVSTELLDLLLGKVNPSGPLAVSRGVRPVSGARELFVAGQERALFLSVLATGEVIVVATPATMSVTVGWTLVRSLVEAMEIR